MTSKFLSSLSEFLTPEEQSALKENVPGERPHPVGLLLLREEGRSQEAVNTDRALKRVSLADMNWLDRMKSRIIGKNLPDAAGALAELRA